MSETVTLDRQPPTRLKLGSLFFACLPLLVKSLQCILEVRFKDIEHKFMLGAEELTLTFNSTKGGSNEKTFD